MSSTREANAALRGPPHGLGARLSDVPEDQWFDRKSARIKPRDLANHLIGFANADGGLIVVGIHDGVAEGVDSSPSSRNALMQAHIDFCDPPVPCDLELIECEHPDGNSDHLLLISVRPGERVYANSKDEVYLRVGDETRRLTYAQRQELMYDRGQGSYEARPVPEAPISSVDHKLLSQYASTLASESPERLLQARGLANSGDLTVAGLLLFGQEPQRVFPESFVRVIRYRGRDRGTGTRQELVGDHKIDGPIPHQLMKAREIVRADQPRRRALSSRGRFEEVPLVPEDAWLEGIVNAAVHRSYSLAGDHIRVEIFSDRIEIYSPGRFPGVFSTSDPLQAPRYARNPRVARVCADLHFGQELGEGIHRMFEEMRMAGLADPMYQQTHSSVRLTLSAEPIDRQLEARLPRDWRAIVALLRDAERLSTGEIAEALEISRVSASQRLKLLRDNGLIVWSGKSQRDPRASWSLPDL